MLHSCNTVIDLQDKDYQLMRLRGAMSSSLIPTPVVLHAHLRQSFTATLCISFLEAATDLDFANNVT